MTPRITLATAARILKQLRGDHRTVALIVAVPCVLLGLLAWIYVDSPVPVFDRVGAALLGVFPFVVMFIVTSVATLRERTTGTLERLLASLWVLVLVALLDALLGTALGLLASGFARTEFQAVQFMPAFVLPQFLLCGLLVPRDQLPRVLEVVSDLLPLSYAVDAMKEITTQADPQVWGDVAIIAAFVIASLAVGSLTLHRRTP